jgi:hypothetical protein
MLFNAYADAVDGPRAPFGAPNRKRFFDRRGRSFKCLRRPVPVVFLRFAFSPQLYLRMEAAGYPAGLVSTTAEF